MKEFLEIFIKVLSIIGTVLTILTMYQAVFVFIGFFWKKTYKPTSNYHKYGICVPARNEEKVIKNFLESISNQDYPLENITIFIVADNCTDNTKDIALDYHKDHPELNIVVYEHNNKDEKTKGFALKYLFEQIKNDYGIEAFEGYYIFDADNVLARDYLTRMNEAFDEGNKIITSCRNSKNFDQNWISYSYAIHWLRTCAKDNRAKAILNQACRIQGTGFLFSNELVKDGWKYTSFTEDRSFCSDAVVQNYRIVYCDDAMFYDEQPYKLKVALRQRLRWAKGHIQSTVENCPKLLRNIFKRSACFTTTYDCFWLNFPSEIEGGVRKLLTLIANIIIACISTSLWTEAIGTIGGIFLGILTGYITGYLTNVLTGLFDQIIVFIVYRKRLPKLNFWKVLAGALMFPFFSIIGKWCTYLALFKKVEWKPIPHDTVIDVTKI